jgi:hypothetical protein
MATLQLRQMSFGEILDASFSVYRRIFGTLVAIAIACQGIPSVLSVYVETAGGARSNVGLWGLVYLLSFLAALLSFGASLWAISEAYLGRQPTVGYALRYALRRAWKLFVAGVVSYILIMLGVLLFIIPGFIVMAGLAVVPQVAVLESLAAPTDAVGRSWRLTKGYKWRAFGLLVVSLIILYAPILALAIIGGITNPEMIVTGETPAFVTVVGQVIWLLLYPILNCVFTLYYYDLRVRKEGFDLEHLSQQMGLATATV